MQSTVTQKLMLVCFYLITINLPGTWCSLRDNRRQMAKIIVRTLLSPSDYQIMWLSTFGLLFRRICGNLQRLYKF
jgi:hypothetical protein